MIKSIKIKQEIIKLQVQTGKAKTEIDKQRLDIYFMLLGYFACKDDQPLFDTKNILNNITSEIKKIIGNNNISFFSYSSNSYESFSIANDLWKKTDDNYDSLKESIDYFYFGYDYCSSLYDRPSIMDYLILNKSVKVERKLLKVLENNSNI